MAPLLAPAPHLKAGLEQVTASHTWWSTDTRSRPSREPSGEIQSGKGLMTGNLALWDALLA